MQYKFAATLNPTREAYEELQAAYEFFNARLFDGQLPRCLITLQRKKRTYGYFATEQFVSRIGALADEIALNPASFATRSVPQVLSTLVHEMAHLWQQHFGAPGRGRYHNGEWADKMEGLGLMPSHTGAPGGNRTGDQMTHYIVDSGSFAVACAELLSSAAVITWLDRYPDELAKVEAGVVGLMAPTKQGQGSDKSNRVKYSHPCLQGEAVNVWGKPGLTLDCGVCGERFNEE